MIDAYRVCGKRLTKKSQTWVGFCKARNRPRWSSP